jgi:hypothetical protein
MRIVSWNMNCRVRSPTERTKVDGPEDSPWPGDVLAKRLAPRIAVETGHAAG